MNFFRQAALRYDRLLHRRPLLVKSVTSGVVVCAADVGIQTFFPDAIEGDDALGSSEIVVKNSAISLDLKRTAVIGIGYGALWFAPVLHFVTTRWAKFLPSVSLGALAFKSVVDMTTSFPINLSVMISLQSYAREGGRAQPVQSVQKNLWPSLKDGWCFWPFISMVMYGSVPLHYRVLFLNSMSLFWNGWMIARFEKH
jgi:protein Mpv17